ncbi:MAG: metal-dependent transcriptional regulator [bacterium]|nr:metal-dependent transcriptional regulator [bacterium]
MTISPALEDYLESIFIINSRKNSVRVKDIAKFAGVKPPSVIEALNHLQDKGLIDHERYGYIELTSEGNRLAQSIYEKHNILKKFFNDILCIDEKTAGEDACKIEHYLSKETLERIVSFIRFIETSPSAAQKPNWLNNFHYFTKHNKRPSSCPRPKKGK